MSAHEIRSLDERTVERIAAGEVVERPASVVKELVENSLDAGATRIAVTVVDGGTEYIRVSDDGIGIPGSELEKAVEKHATSKLRDADDLSGGIETLGFRGEALHTIGAVSRMQLTTRHREAREGATIDVDGGVASDVAPAGCPEGTTVEVSELFFNTPARRAFLGTTGTEFDHVNRIVTTYALANADVAVSLSHGDREIFATPGRGDLQETVLAVWGREVAEAMYPISVQPDINRVDAIDGLVSDPETTRSRPRYLATFVNGRAVRSGELREGILEGYGHHLAPDRYPFVVLFCSVPPRTVDVNVHPRKTEVRFEDSDAVIDAVAEAIESTFHREGIIRSTAARGKGTPMETTVPSFDDATEPRTESKRGGDIGTAPSPSGPVFTPSLTQRTLPGPEPGPDLEQLPNLRILGQLTDTYIVAEANDGLLLVDQHAADERIHFERLREKWSRQTLTQELVEPVDIELTSDEAAAFDSVYAALAQLGFDAEAQDDRRIRVTGVPTILDANVAPDDIRDAVGSAIEHAEADTVDALAEKLIADMACRPAVTGNVSLAEGSMIDLLEALDACENPYACPHGRPTIIRIDADELSDRFERDYPGHAMRRSEVDDLPPSA